MATYATYWHPSVVHAGPTPGPYTAAAPAHPLLQLRLDATAPPLFAAASRHTDAYGAVSAAERESVSAKSPATVAGRVGELGASLTMTVEPAPNPQTTSLFFRLPAELRNQIYTQLLCPDALPLKELAAASHRQRLNYMATTRTSTPTLHPSILSTCRRAHAEAHRLLYTPHVFHAHPSLLAALPHLASPSKPVLYPHVTALITRWQISLRLDTDPRFTFGQATAAFSGAEYLEVRVWQAQFEACDYSVLKLFTGVRGVKIARVGGSVDFALAAWLEGVMMQPREEEEHEHGRVCLCDDELCPGFEGRREIVCGRCYRKVGVDWVEKEWDLWRFGVAS